MANLSNINNKFLVTTGGNVLIGQTGAVGSPKLQVDGGATFMGSVSVGVTGAVTDRRFQVTSGTYSSLTATTNQYGVVINPTYASNITNSIYNLYNGPALASGTTLTNLYNLYLEANGVSGSTVTNSYGVYQSGGGDKNYFAGNVGIGTTLPSTKTEILETNNDIYQLTIFNSHVSTTAKTRIGNWANEVKISSNLMQRGGTKTQDDATKASWVLSMGAGPDAFNIQRSNAGSTTLTNYLTIDSLGNSTFAGNVGIGAAPVGNPGTKILAVGTAGTTAGGIQLWAANNQAHYLQFGDANSGGEVYRGGIGYNHSSETLLFLQNSSTALSFTGSQAATFAGNVTTGGQITVPSGYSVNIGSSRIHSTDTSYLLGGNVGIGTTSPTRKLHIVNTDDTRGILVENTLATSYAEVQVKASREFRIGTGNSSSATDARDRFYVYDATAAAHRFTIDSSGNVGIGTTSPSVALDVTGEISSSDDINAGGKLVCANVGSDKKIAFRRTGANNFSIEHDSSSLYFYNESTTELPIRFFNNGNVSMIAGNVGIGTTSPSAKLNVVGSGNGVGIRISGDPSAGGAYYYGIMHDGTNLRGTTQTNLLFTEGSVLANTTIATWASLRIAKPSTTATGAVITNNYAIYQESNLQKNYFNGNVGIGTISPSATLEINSSVGNQAKIRVGRQVGTSNYLELGTLGGESTITSIGTAAVNGTLIINRSTTTTSLETARFNADGNVGIGTTDPGNYKLKVNGAVSGTNVYANSSGGSFVFGASTSEGDYIFRQGGTHNMSFHTDSSERMRIQSDGNVGIGNTNPYSVLDVDGVITNRTASQDPNFTVTANGMSVQDSGSLQFTQGFAGTSSAGDTVVFTYSATSWKSWNLEFVFTSTGNGSGQAVCKGNIGGYNNNNGGGNSNFTQNLNTPITAVATNSGQHVIVTFTGDFGIHMMCDMRYSQGGGDGSPRADRASLTYNS